MAAIFMLSVLAATSVFAMTQREELRETRRQVIPATEPSPTDLIMFGLFGYFGDDMWQGEQFTVVWIEPAGSVEPTLPPGVPKLPKPGQAVVSPALARLASQEPALAARYPDRLLLEPEGLRSGNELLAYVRAPEGRAVPGTLGENTSTGSKGIRVQGFGPSTGTVPSLMLGFPSPMDEVPLVKGALGFLVLPGLIVLVIGVATTLKGVGELYSSGKLDWARLPEWSLLVLGTLILAIPGLVVVSVLWTLFAPRLKRVPLVDQEVVRGDLGLPLWLLAAELIGAIAVIVIVALLIVAVRRYRVTERSRLPNLLSKWIANTSLTAIPICAAIVAITIGGIIGRNVGAALQLSGIFAATLGMPLLLPIVVYTIVLRFNRLKLALVSDAARDINLELHRITRPFFGIAILITFSIASIGFLEPVRHEEPPSLSSEEAQAVFVHWLNPLPNDFARLANTLGTGLLVPFNETKTAHENDNTSEHDHGHEHGNTLLVGATCSQLAPYFSGTSCDEQAPYELPTLTEQKLIHTLSLAAHNPDSEIKLVPTEDVVIKDGSVDIGNAIMLDDTLLKVLEKRVRVAAMRMLPAPSVYSLLSSAERRAQLPIAWVTGGAIVALSVLTIGSFVLLMDRFLSIYVERYRDSTVNSDVSARHLAGLAAWQFIILYGIVVFVSLSVGILVCALTVAGSLGVPMPWYETGIVIGIAAIIGLIGSASVAFLSVRIFRGSTPFNCG